ncbi:MAG: trypsin-like peptidase domain-containing protein [Clostridia bacterium]|nr:trypsin-like peptidase domain-containing protein [Clostridia bacterium]
MDSENNKGELNGFDFVNGKGGSYNKQKNEIIQDEVDNSRQFNQTSINNNSQGSYYNPKPAKKVKKKIYGLGTVIVSSVLAAVIGASAGIAVILSSVTDNFKPTEKGETILNKVNINVDEEAENIVEAVAQKATPSVVGIRTTTSVMSFFGGTQESSGDGSGVIYSSDGYIITNYHVISSAINGNNAKITVFLDSADSNGYAATVVGYNISSDLAVIKIDAKNLSAVEFANSDELKVGQYVITIGNPGGLEFMDSVTYGVISGLNRVVSSDIDVKLIQTDAAINPGNSGGALLNAKGQLVGINSSKIVSEEFEGMGFAIPSNTVADICKNIIERQNSPEPYIGISISERYTSQVLKHYGFPSGAVVLSVASGSPAEKAGIQRGDIITEYDGKKITEYTILENEIMNSKPGEKVKVKIYRGGGYYETEIIVASNNAVD